MRIASKEVLPCLSLPWNRIPSAGRLSPISSFLSNVPQASHGSQKLCSLPIRHSGFLTGLVLALLPRPEKPPETETVFIPFPKPFRNYPLAEPMVLSQGPKSGAFSQGQIVVASVPKTGEVVWDQWAYNYCQRGLLSWTSLSYGFACCRTYGFLIFFLSSMKITFALPMDSSLV